MTPSQRNRRAPWSPGALGALALLIAASGADAQPAPPSARVAAAAPAASASTAPPGSAAPPTSAAVTPPPEPPAPAPAPVTPPAVADLERTASHVRALVAGDLDPAVRPADLFDVPLGDEAAIAVESRRLAALLASAEVDATRQGDEGAGGGGGDAAPAPPPMAQPATPTPGATGEPPEPPPPEPTPAPPDDALAARWVARLELDRARLAFLSLPEARRAELLAAHAARRSTTEAKLDEAMQRAATASADRDRALEEARAARTEAARLVAEETARLLGVTKAQAEFEASLTRERQALGSSQEELLRRQRILRELLDGGSGPPPADADRIYGEIHDDLVTARRRLAAAVSALETGRVTVPTAGEDRLATIAVDVDTAAARAVRADVEQRAADLAREELALHEEVADRLLEQTVALNRARLQLLPHLSPARREAVRGTGPVGRDQARGEVRQVTLVLRRHAVALVDWIERVRSTGSARGVVGWGELGAIVRLLPAIVLFVLLRRHAGPLLTGIRDRARSEKRALLGTSPAEAIASFLLRIRGPAQWLVLLFLAGRLLPEEVVGLLEVELLFTVAEWALGGALVVRAIDALARPTAQGATEKIVDRLRWRSLVLGGRLVVAFGLILAVTERLVGPGTIYAWTLTAAWAAAIPVVLVVVRWWRPVIFRRQARRKDQGGLARWIAAHRRGVWSPVATTVALAQLLVTAAVRAARLFVGSQELGRRALAYLFRRDLSRKREPRPELPPLPEALRAAIGPDKAVPARGPLVATRAAILARVRGGGGGVVAVVGERGLGKTTLLESVRRALPDAAVASCAGGPEAARAELAATAGLRDDAPLDRIAAALADGPAVLLDDATHLLRPGMGGLAGLDALVAAARGAGGAATWVFAFDATVWPFVRVARSRRPLFDEVIVLRRWSEVEIGELIDVRTRAAGAVPSFERLLGPLPVADEDTRKSAVARVRASYARLIWDYALGNPAVALEAWCSSLRRGDDRRVVVELFSPPVLDVLESLPDEALFTLRAVLQLEPATVDAVVTATLLPRATVESALRFAIAHGFLREEEGRHRVTWAWYRPLTSFLERRHLLEVVG